MNTVEEFEAARQANLLRRQGAKPAARGPRSPLWCDDASWSEGDLQKRPWVVRGFLMRRAVTVAAGQGGAGKSSLVCAWATAMALGEAHGTFCPTQRLKVLVYSVEDDGDELRRRFSAALRQFGRAAADLAGRVLRCGPTSVGTLIDRDANSGMVALTEAWDALEQLLAEFKPDVLVLDPMAEIHTSEESDNTALRMVMALLRELAQRHDCAVLLLHHTRKGSVAGEVDSIRGASAIVGAARIALTVTPMADEEADEFGIARTARRGYFRVDAVKANYSVTTGAAWHTLDQYELDNGETVAGAVPWTPPGRVDRRQVDPEILERLGAEICRGTSSGPYSPRLSTDQPRSVLGILNFLGVKGTANHKRVLAALIEDGFEVAEYRDPQRRTRTGIRHPERGPKAMWLVAEAPPADLLAPE